MPSTTDEPLLTIGQLAERAGLNTSHIRFYEKVGVLPEPERVWGSAAIARRCCTASRSSTSRNAPG